MLVELLLEDVAIHSTSRRRPQRGATDPGPSGRAARASRAFGGSAAAAASAASLRRRRPIGTNASTSAAHVLLRAFFDMLSGLHPGLRMVAPEDIQSVEHASAAPARASHAAAARQRVARRRTRFGSRRARPRFRRTPAHRRRRAAREAREAAAPSAVVYDAWRRAARMIYGPRPRTARARNAMPASRRAPHVAQRGRHDVFGPPGCSRAARRFGAVRPRRSAAAHAARSSGGTAPPCVFRGRLYDGAVRHMRGRATEPPLPAERAPRRRQKRRGDARCSAALRARIGCSGSSPRGAATCFGGTMRGADVPGWTARVAAAASPSATAKSRAVDCTRAGAARGRAQGVRRPSGRRATAPRACSSASRALPRRARGAAPLRRRASSKRQTGRRATERAAGGSARAPRGRRLALAAGQHVRVAAAIPRVLHRWR